MLKRRFGLRVCLGLGVIFTASFSYGDTLELLNGDILEGVFKGGTQNSIRFATEGTLKTIPVTDVLALTISREASVSGSTEPVPTEHVHEAEVMPVEPLVPEKEILAPTGTALLVRFIDEVDSRKHEVGHRFAVALETDFAHEGNVIAPVGTTLYGKIVDVKQAGRLKGKTHLAVELLAIRLDGRLFPVVSSEYKQVGKKSSGKRSALEILGGAALGALIGKDDRAKGAAIGAGVGLGVAAITKGEKISIPRDTLIEFQLGAPFTM